jgi:ABC-2 type transport system ATP-binding protein
MSAIRVEGLRKSFGPLQALDGLTFAVEPGTVFGFLGPNGAGKTTTLRILAGLARPDAGLAWIAGERVGPESPARRILGYLPEEPHFFGWMTPTEFLGDYVGGLFGMPPAAARTRALELLDLVGLSESRRRRIAGFSRGMRQRLGLAQALINRPGVVLLDEPVSALDPSGRREMLLCIERLKLESTVLMSTHILDDVERVCDTVAIIDHGRLVALDARQALLDRYAIPAVELEFDAAPDSVRIWAETLHSQPGVAAVSVAGHQVRIRLDGEPSAGRALLRLAVDSGLPVQRFAMAKPTLEDVFLRLVGPQR